MQLSKDGSRHVTDEVANTIISSLGAVLAVLGTAYLIRRSYLAEKPEHVLSFLVYGFGVFSVFLTSALHHGVDGSPRTNHFFRQLDYCAIFLMIAGTATPFCLHVVPQPLGTRALAALWLLAIAGILCKALYPGLPKWATLAQTIGMGWLGIFVFKPIYEALPWQGFAALVLGGIFFTGGGMIYGLEKPNPVPGKFGFHEIWHCCVLAGAASHFYCVSLC